MHKVSIHAASTHSVIRADASNEDRVLMTLQELENNMAVLLGGRAAERLGALIFERVTTGAADDLVKVTEIARSMVTRYGMSQKLGQLSYEGNRHCF